jgi:FKBP-type peptidyl-prolyl cis-trans isomerase
MHGGAEVTLLSKILKAGDGEVMPADTDVVTFHYTSWTADGELLGSSTSLGSPVVLTLGDDMLPGLREALKLMRVGERRRVWIPEALTWAHLPGAPQGTLVYEFELFEIGAPPPPDDEEIPGRL